MKRNSLRQKGFTLIELLVVISIIGILSSVVLASLTSAKLKARDAVVKQTLAQMDNLMTLEYADTGSYDGLQVRGSFPGVKPWVHQYGNGCEGINAVFTSQYKGEILKLCKEITEKQNMQMYFGTASTDSQKYAVAAQLPSNNFLAWCVGSSGKNPNLMSGPWNASGCWANP